MNFLLEMCYNILADRTSDKVSMNSFLSWTKMLVYRIRFLLIFDFRISAKLMLIP